MPPSYQQSGQYASQPTPPQVSGPALFPPAGDAADIGKPHSSVLAHVAWALVVFAAAAGVYLWQHSQISDLTSKLSASQASLKAAQGAQTTAGQYVSDSVAAVPVSLKTKKITLTLTLPTGQNALNLAPGTNTPAGMAGYFATSSNDLLANWQFQPKGTPDSPADTTTTGNVFVSDMAQWAAVADAAPAAYPGVGTKQMSVADKTAFISQLKTDTGNCTDDAAKGFATGDKVFNICYSLAGPQAKGGSWMVTLKGYGEPAGLPVYFGGSISVGPDASYKSTVQTYVGALKQFKTLVANSRAS